MTQPGGWSISSRVSSNRWEARTYCPLQEELTPVSVLPNTEVPSPLQYWEGGGQAGSKEEREKPPSPCSLDARPGL